MNPFRRVVLLLCLSAAGCRGGSVPTSAPRTPPATAMASATSAAATSMPIVTALPLTGTATAPPTATPAPAVAPSSTPDPLAISPGNASRLAQAAQVGEAKLDQVVWSPSGDRLATAGAQGVLVYDAGSMEPVRSFDIGAWATSLAFSPDGKALAIGSVDSSVQVFDLDTGDPLFLLGGQGAKVEHIAFSPDSRRQLLAAVGSDGSVQLWDLGRQQHAGTLLGQGGPVHNFSFSPGGRWLAASAEYEVVLWRAGSGTGQPARVFQQRYPVTAVAFGPLPERLILASGSRGGTVELWNAGTGEHLGTLGPVAAPPHTIAFSPEGRMLASAYLDKVIRLWDVTVVLNEGMASATRPLAALSGHTDLVTSLAFSPDGRTLASSSWDATARLWRLPHE